MNQATQLIAEQYRNAALNKKMFGDAFYIATAYDIFPDGSDVTNKLQALVNLANSEGRRAIFFPHGDYYVTYINNDDNIYYFGDNAKFIGGYDGVISQIGVENGSSSSYELIKGMEYLYHYHEKLRTKMAVKLIFSGDSTTFGVSISDSDFLLNNAAKNYLADCGYNYVTSINAGHSSMRTTDWYNQYLAEDMAQNPDLYILRWGLNDGAYIPKEDRLNVFKNALIGGLQNIRSQKSVQELSIVLMMPNSTNDTPNGRDTEWFNAIYPIIKQAAKDYHCCFVDTYHYLQDSTNVVWEDDPYGDGRHIHPFNTGNAWIISLLEDVLVPPVLRNHGVTNRISTDVTKLVSAAPDTYPMGLSIYRCAGFPYDGIVTTIRSFDNVLIQFNSSYQSMLREGIAVRRGIAVSGTPGSIGDNAWSPWIYLSATESPQNLALQNSWTAFGGSFATPSYYMDGSGIVHLRGTAKGGSTTDGTVIANLPAGYRRSQDAFYAVNCGAGYGRITISSNGDIKVSYIADNSFLSLDGICFRAEQ